MDTPTVTPTVLTAGLTWQWDKDYPDFPRPTWSATAYLENASDKITVTSAANATAQRFSATAAVTAAYKVGRYRLRVLVTDGSSTYEAESGWLDVESNPASAATVDQRSWAKRTLDAIEAFLEGNATTAQQSMSIAGRSISRWSLAELTQFRNELRGEVRGEEQGSDSGLGRDIRVRLNRA